MRAYRVSEEYEPLKFLGEHAKRKNRSPSQLAEFIAQWLGITSENIRRASNTTEVFKMLREKLEQIGVIVNISGIVNSNTHRKLDLNEFRAFTIIDDYAPVIFVNDQDSETGRILSIVHEFAHLLIGEDGITRGDPAQETECNRATIEFLAPVGFVRAKWGAFEDDRKPEERIAEMSDELRISRIALAIRLKKLGLINESYVEKIRQITNDDVIETRQRNDGGNYWNNKLFSVSRSFARAIVSQAQSGSTPYTEAFRLLGIKKHLHSMNFRRGCSKRERCLSFRCECPY